MSPVILYIFDQDEELIQILDNNGAEKNYHNPLHTEQLNGENRFEFTVPAHLEFSDDVKEGHFVGFRDLDNDFQLFEIKRVVEIHSDVLEKKAFSEHVIFELLDDQIIFKQHFDQGANFILNDILTSAFDSNPTRWNVGTVEPAGTADRVRFRLTNKYSAMRSLTDAFDGELKFRLIFEDNAIQQRLVDLLNRRGSDTGKRFVYGKDLKNIKREIDVNDIKTAMFGFGKAQELAGEGKQLLRFRDVDFDGTIDGDSVVKPVGQIFVEDPDAKELWGRRTKNLVSQNQSSAEFSLEGFTENGSTITRNNTESKFGDWSVFVDTDGFANQGVNVERDFIRDLSSGGIDITFSSWLKSTAVAPNDPLKFRIFEYNASSVFIKSTDSPSFIPSQDNFERFDFTVKTDDNTAKILVVIANAVNSFKEWFVDGIQLEENDHSTAWTIGGIFNRFGVFTDSEEVDPDSLLENTWRFLQENNTPLLNFDMNVLDLEDIAGIDHEKVRLGDSVKVIDTEFKPELRLTARVTELRRNLEEPENNRIILANLLPRVTDDGQTLRENSRQINTNVGIWEGAQFVPNLITDHSFENIPRTGNVLNLDQEFSVDLTHPDIGNAFWWNWDGTDPRIVSFLNTDVSGTLFDLQGAVVSAQSKPFIEHGRHFTIPNFGLDGAYTASCFVSAYGQTSSDGIFILKYSAVDNVGAIVKTVERREVIRADQQVDFKRVEATIRDLPGSTETLKIELLIDEVDNPNLKVLADGVQAVPIENALPYNPESNLWKNLRSLAGVKAQEPTFIGTITNLENSQFSAAVSTAQSLTAGTFDTIQFDTVFVDNQNEFDTSNFQFVSKNSGVYLFSIAITTSGNADGDFNSLSINKNGSEDSRPFQFKTGGSGTMTAHASQLVFVSGGDVIEIRLFTSSATTVVNSGTRTFWKAIRVGGA